MTVAPRGSGRWRRLLSAIPRGRRIWALVALVGWWLSPLTAWNDAFTNIPLSIGLVYLLKALGWQVDARRAAVVVYLLTNVVGLLLLWLGMGKLAQARPEAPRGGWVPRMVLRTLFYMALTFLTVWALDSMLAQMQH